jgi:hypothetical protein
MNRKRQTLLLMEDLRKRGYLRCDGSDAETAAQVIEDALLFSARLENKECEKIASRFKGNQVASEIADRINKRSKGG